MVGDRGMPKEPPLRWGNPHGAVVVMNAARCRSRHGLLHLEAMRELEAIVDDE